MARRMVVHFVNTGIRPQIVYDVASFGIGELGELEASDRTGNKYVFAPGVWSDYVVSRYS